MKALALWVIALGVVGHLAWWVRSRPSKAGPVHMGWEWNKEGEVELDDPLTPALAGFPIGKCELKEHFLAFDWHCYPNGGSLMRRPQ